MGQNRNTVIRDPKILCTPLSKFLDPTLCDLSAKQEMFSNILFSFDFYKLGRVYAPSTNKLSILEIKMNLFLQ